MKKPLQDIKVLDLSPRIIKVERPEKGDDTRQWGPPFTNNGESAYFFCANRNKESITLNLKSEEGREILRALVKEAPSQAMARPAPIVIVLAMTL